MDQPRPRPGSRPRSISISTMDTQMNESSESTSRSSHLSPQRSPLELDLDLEVEEQATQKEELVVPSWIVLTRYLSAASTALILTILIPHTTLRDKDNAFHKDTLAGVITVFLLTLFSLACVFQSDPGIVTVDNVPSESVDCQEDGLALLDYKHDMNNNNNNNNNNSSTTNNGSDDDIDRNFIPTMQTSSSCPAAMPQNPDDLFRGTRRRRCEICQMAPPLRSHHCRTCNKCIATFDHHCQFIGTCIGERNHCRFWWFLTFQTIGFCLFSSILESSSLGIWVFLQKPAFDAFIVVVTKCFLYPLTLISTIVWTMHTFFAIANVTTFECGKGPRHIDYLRGTRETDVPFSKGMHSNLHMFCCQRDASMNFLTRKNNNNNNNPWKPILWETPGNIVRDSEDWWENPWQNKYWSCC